ncbi:unnamed protein product [Brachionus calyciflorus]|uniref:Uncharacterized protein n=1 Tax=Brachionus calyciflorus TaxID=104777 RepID=A0A814C153_9BILA|nr:unnamed protein product [Brachionus calyciflorus]
MSDTSIKSNSTSSRSISTSIQMQGLLDEFKLLYQNKLKKFDLQEPLNEETIKLKCKTLESYVKDLLEQNDVLVQTIDELEKEANSRVSKLENKIQKSTGHIKSLQKKIDQLNINIESYEREIRHKNESLTLLEKELERVKESYDETIKTLSCRYKPDESIFLNMTFQNEVHLKNLEDSLSSAIKTKNELIFEIQEKDQKILDLQHELNKVNHDLNEKDYQYRELEERINSKQKSCGKDEFKLHREYLKTELEKEDMNVKLANLNHDISCLLSAFNQAKKTGNFDLKSLNLKEISLEKFGDDEPKRVHFADTITSSNSSEYLRAELRHKEDLINSLQSELKNFKNQYESLLNGLTQKDTVINTIKSNLSTSQNKELLATNQIFDKDMEIRKFKSELNDDKNKINLLTEELTLKKKELSDSKLELCDLSSELKNLRNELIRRDKQINILKDKIHEQSLEISSLQKLNGEMGLMKSDLSDEIKSQYDKRLQDMKQHIDDLQNDRLKLSDEISHLQIKLKTVSIPVQSQSGLESLLQELKARDELIQKLRAEILDISDKRDQSVVENTHLTSRLKQSQKEISDWKKTYEEEHLKNESNMSKFSMYDETLRTLKEQFNESQEQNQRLTLSLQSLQGSSKETRDKLSDELIKRQEEIIKLREELRTLDLNHEAELKEKNFLIDELNTQIQEKNAKISKQLELIDQNTLDLLNYQSKCDELEIEIDKFRAHLNQTEYNSSHLSSITAQLYSKEDHLNKLQTENNHRLKLIENLQTDLRSLNHRYECSIQEIARLEAKLQAHHLDYRNESEILNTEVHKREEQLFRLKMDKENLKEQLGKLEIKLNDYEILISNLKQQNLTNQHTLQTKEDHILQLEKQIDEHKTKITNLNDEIIRLEELNRTNMANISNLQVAREDLENKLINYCDQIFALQHKENLNVTLFIFCSFTKLICYY